MLRLMLVAAGGAIGALLRYAVSMFVYERSEGVFPWGTLIVNLVGCFVIGLLWGFIEKTQISPNIRGFIVIGIIGAFTTFSTYSLESMNLIRNREVGLVIFNISFSNIAGIALAFVGLLSSRGIISLFR